MAENPHAHKDLLYQETHNTIRQELKDARLVAQKSNQDTTPLKFFVSQTGLSFRMGTIEDAFHISGSRQALIYTDNLGHVIDLAGRESRPVDMMAGICLMSNFRIFATNGEFDIQLPPFSFREFHPDARYDIDVLMKVFLARNKREFPGGRPDVGRLDDYRQIIPSSLELEPSIGKALKIFKYFEIAQALGVPVNILVPTQEYIDEIIPMLPGTPFDPAIVETDLVSTSVKFQRFISQVKSLFYPDVSVAYNDSRDSSIRTALDNAAADPALLACVDGLGKNSYGQYGWKVRPETGNYLDRRYSAMFLSKDGKLLTRQDSPSRILFVHARDLTSFATQALYIYQQLISGQDFSWKDRIAIVGVSGGPALRMHNDAELRRYLSGQYRLPEDDYGARSCTTLFLGEPSQTLERKIGEMKPSGKKGDPMYALIRALHHFVDPGNREAEAWLEGYDLKPKTSRFESGKPVLFDLAMKLKAMTGF